MDESINYGNWVPRSVIYFFLGVFLVLLIPTLFPILSIIKIVLWILAGVWLLPFMFMMHLYFYFSANNKAFQYKTWNLVIQKLLWNGQGKALDVGTGSGGLAIQLAKKFPESNIWGIDYWGKTWDYSKQQCEENAKHEGVADQILFQKASASDLPFEDGEFDVIVSNFVYHEVRDTRDKRELINESLRVLKKGGKFSLQDTFLNKRRYGAIEDLIRQIKDWGIQQVNFIETVDEITMPKMIKAELKTMGLLYGIK
ncbi:MAG: class I SAM-dependent methyltransferase [Promethearchaeota archaeon]